MTGTGGLLDRLSQPVLDLLPAAVFIASVPDGEIVRRNQRAAAWCRVDSPSLPLWERLHAVAAGGARYTAGTDPIEIALRRGDRIQDVEAILDAIPVCIPLSVSVEPIQGDDGVPIATLTLCQPIARWKDAETALRRTEQRLTLALGAGRLGAWEYDLRTRHLTASAQCKANHGFAPTDDMQLETEIVSAIDPDHRDAFRAAIGRAIDSGEAFEIEVPHRFPDGSRHWLLVAGRVMDPTCMVGVSLDITDRRHTDLALRESERRYKEIVETANEGIWTLDPDAAITFVNPRMADLLGYPAAEMIGRHKWDFVFDEDIPVMRDLYERRRQGVAEEVMDLRFRRRDGREVWTLMAARPIYDAMGQFVGALDLFTDVTERRRSEQALIAADRSKDEFLALIAHELRGPLAPILTAVKLLQMRGPEDPALAKLRDTILRQTLQLSRLVEDLLDVGRIISGKLRLDREAADLNTIVRQAIETCTPLIERRGHVLTTVFAESPLCVEVDAARIVQVVCNLLNNAAKYMRDGGRIELTVRERDGTAVIAVRDEGVGIGPEMLGRIFQRFVQVDSSTHRAQGGLGLGLALVKAIVELHGGTVEAHSDGIGTGSVFTVRLPVRN